MYKNPTAEQIRKELYTILEDKVFSGSRRASDFLKYIVEETLAGRENQLKEYTIGVEVYKKGSDFLPQADPVVRIEAGRLRKKLEQYYLSHKDEGIEITIPKGGYIPRFRRRDSRLPGKQAASNSNHRPSISINPFEAVSNNNPSLISELVYQEFKKAFGKSEDFSLLVDHDSSVDFQLSGKLYKRRHSLLLYCDLIETSSGSLIWTDNYTLKSPGRFPIRIAEAVAAQVSATITGRGGILYDLIAEQMQGTEELPEDIFRMRVLFVLHKKLMEPGTANRLKVSLERMISKDEERGDLKALLSQVYWDFCMDVDWNAMINHDDSFDFYRNKAINLTKQAQELDPEGEDTLVCGIRSAFHENDSEKLKALTERLFRSNDVSALSMATGALLYSLSGGWESGMTILDTTLPLLPSYPGWFHHLTCQYHLRQMDYEIVIEKAGRFSQGDVLWHYLYTAAALSLLGNIAEGLIYWSELIKQCPAIKNGIHNFLGNYVKEEKLIELIISGLKPLGLEQDITNKKPPQERRQTNSKHQD